MSDSVEYFSLMDYIKVNSDFNIYTREMLNNLIQVLILKEVLDYNEVEFIRTKETK